MEIRDCTEHSNCKIIKHKGFEEHTLGLPHPKVKTKRCVTCGKVIYPSESVFQVKIITNESMHFVPTCSDDCAEKTKAANAATHLENYY